MKIALEKLSHKQKILVVIGVSAILIIAFIFLYKYLYREENQVSSNDINQNELEQNVINQFELSKNKNNIMVHVIGEIKTPGVVSLDEGSRIIDAINECGGTTDNADLSKINLAFVLEDGVQIYIPRVNENNENPILIKEDAGEGIITETATQEDSQTKQIKVNINTANEEKLKTLPGVGDSMAKKIVAYRNKNGKFNTLEDLKKVNGIGESKYNSLKEYITIK